MENTNKPQWLIDAENDIQEFNDSKYAQLSQTKLNQSLNAAAQRAKRTPEQIKTGLKKAGENGGFKQSDVQRRNGIKGASKGGRASYQKLLSELGQEGYNKLMQQRLYDRVDKKDFHKKGNAASQATIRARKEVLWNQIIDALPEVFTAPETEPIMIRFGLTPFYFNSSLKHRCKDRFEIVEKGKKGWSHTKYRKL